MAQSKPLLYRKYNKRARGFQRNAPKYKFRHERNSKELKALDGTRRRAGRTRSGYDYTPLFKFLLSRTGQAWAAVFTEALSRLDRQDPIFWLVDLHFETGQPGTVRIGESSYYSKLTVKDGLLVKAEPNAALPIKKCTCCTHTLNGIPY